MNVASLELSKELYELSGWKDTEYGWLAYSDWETNTLSYELSKQDKKRWVAGAYDLGYLLRKIDQVAIEHYEGRWKALHMTSSAGLTADTPEDAACKLAIELFKQKVLTNPAP